MKCTSCSLYKKSSINCMPGAGNPEAKIMLIGEAPGAAEERIGLPFVGPAGDMLSKILKKVGISRKEVFLTNVLRCRPPNNQLPDSKKELREMLDVCFPYLKDEILNVKPKVVVPMGNVALLSLTGKEGITKKRGEVIRNDDLNVDIIPTIHPAAVLRNPQYEDIVVSDFEKIKAYVEGRAIRKPVKYVVVRNREMAEKLFKRLSEVDLFSFDIESNDVMFDSPLLGIGFSWKEQTGVYLPLVGQFLEDVWKDDYKWIVESLKKVLSGEQEKIAHNGKFDLKVLMKNGFSVKNFCFDTMLAHYLAVTEIRGTHGLKNLAWMYTDMGGYDRVLDNYPFKKEGFKCIPMNVLGEYCCGDVDITLRLYHIFREKIKEEGMEYLFKILVTASRALAFTELNGVKVDIGYLKKLKSDFSKEIQLLESKMRKVGGIEKIEDEKVKARQKELREKYYGSKTLQKKYSEVEYIERVKKEPFNFRSTKQLRKLLFEKMKLPVVKRTKTGPSTDEETLVILSKRGRYSVVELLLKYRKVNKLLSTYVEGMLPLVDVDDRIHTTYLLHGTTTGRLSSSKPNLQNIPRDSLIKNVFIASEGGKLVEADYAQAEFRVWAHLSKDSQMIRDIKSGVDIHKKTASTVYGIPLKEITKKQRQIAKGVTFGLMYGRGVDSVAEEFGISKVKARRIVDSFFASYPKAKQWLAKTKIIAKERGYVKNVFGRKRRLSDLTSSMKEVVAEAERMAINAPIQSTASDLTLISLVRMTSRIKKQNKKTGIVLTVHDSIIFDVPKDEIKWVVENVVDVMENPTVDLLVSMTAEIKIGDRWGDLEEINIDEFLEGR